MNSACAKFDQAPVFGFTPPEGLWDQNPLFRNPQGDAEQIKGTPARAFTKRTQRLTYIE